MRVLVRCLSMMLLGAMILTGSPAPAHAEAMGGSKVQSSGEVHHRGHGADETGPDGSDAPCEICGMAMAGDCTAPFCHPGLVVEAHSPAAPHAPSRHDPGKARDLWGTSTEVLIPPPRHLL